MFYYNIPNSQKMYFTGISSIAKQKSYMLESVIIPYFQFRGLFNISTGRNSWATGSHTDHKPIYVHEYTQQQSAKRS